MVLPGRATSGWLSVFVVVALALVAGLQQIGAQSVVAGSSDSDRRGFVFKSGVELVELTVTVEDPKGRYVSSLGVDDFRVFEDGVQQTVAYFGGGEVPIDLLLMIDTSSSMFDRIRIARGAASNFVSVVGPADRAAVMAFSSSAQMLVPFTSDRESLEEAIGRLTTNGDTALYNALYVALRQFEKLSPNTDVRRRAIVVLSDGDDTTSLVSFDSLLELARRAGIAVYVISFGAHGQPKDHVISQGVYRMRVLAKETGAMSFFPRTIEDLDGVYQEIARELAHQYAIAYVPSSPSKDKKFRRVAVAVDQPDVHVRTRSGYIAE